MNFGHNLWNKVFNRVYGLTVNCILSLSGHPLIINKIYWKVVWFCLIWKIWYARFVKKIHTYFIRLNPKKGPFLLLPSSIARNSEKLKTKRIFQIHRGILEIIQLIHLEKRLDGAWDTLVAYEWKAKAERALSFRIQSGNITVWIANSTKLVSTCCCVGLVFNSLKKPDKRSEKMKKANNSTTRYFLHCYQTLPLDLIYLLKGDTF